MVALGPSACVAVVVVAIAVAVAVGGALLDRRL
jgi:hypothetical protein